MTRIATFGLVIYTTLQNLVCYYLVIFEIKNTDNSLYINTRSLVSFVPLPDTVDRVKRCHWVAQASPICRGGLHSILDIISGFHKLYKQYIDPPSSSSSPIGYFSFYCRSCSRAVALKQRGWYAGGWKEETASDMAARRSWKKIDGPKNGDATGR